ncbi:unnamed protein product [Urochloa decumbens]|uniref:Uncharacterized protein n=1 Tax=Urochloa decumbens TaxID=240449 RepID=A0ABC9APG2_9POAL
MEALHSASLGAMGSLLRKVDALLQTQDWAPNIRQLREDVGSISTKLVKLSEIHDPPLTVNYWMKDARELSYDIEDCVDQFIHADADAKMTWDDEISGFCTRAEEVRERYDRFKLEYVLSRPAVLNTVANYRLGTVNSEHKSIVPAGMEGATNEVLGWLEPNGDDEKELQLRVVCILGGVGVGKSTLVQKLWRKLAEEFECRAFVQVGKTPDMRMILRSILSQVRPHQLPEVCLVPNLIQDIRKYLQDKRYFVIVDDIWSVSVWDALSRAFSEGYCCSRIITTTTIEDVALACCSYDPVHIFKMKALSADQSKELFSSTVFCSAKEHPQQFHNISDVITSKCGGLPLAITCIATLVASLPERIQQWEYVQNFLCNNLRTNSTSEEVMKQVLKLCYCCLPQCMKACLLYISVYPENYMILKEDLVKQWVVEGFICTIEGRDQIEVARNYFDEFLSLGLIQRIDINSKKKGLSYALHPCVFDFITCKSLEDNFITIIDYSQSTIPLTDRIRRLSLHFGGATYATTPATIGLSQVRSLAFMGLLNCMPSLEEFKLVRVVILHFRCDDGDIALTEICGLHLLRYLQVRCNATVLLPDQIQCLKYLETLEIMARVGPVPSGIVNVSSLLHVHLGDKTNSTQGPVESSSDDSSSLSFPPIFLRSFELLPPICIFSRLPMWIRQLHKLCVLKIVVTELQWDDISVLTELPELTSLSLYVLTRPIAKYRFFRKMEFPALEYFKFVCSVLLLGFQEEAMPNLRRLKIGFNAQRGWKYSYMLPGIQNLLNLKEVAAKIGADTDAEESDRRAAESAFKNAFSIHPCRPSLNVKRVGLVGGQYDSSSKHNWSQQKVFLEQDKFHSETQKEEPFVEQSKILGKMPNDTKHATTWIPQFCNTTEGLIPPTCEPDCDPPPLLTSLLCSTAEPLIPVTHGVDCDSGHTIMRAHPTAVLQRNHSPWKGPVYTSSRHSEKGQESASGSAAALVLCFAAIAATIASPFHRVFAFL